MTIKKEFNVTGLCVPGKHYMADISDKIAEIMKMIEKGYYFTINRARQYGKTTTLNLLEKNLPKEYTVIKISFEALDDKMFTDSASFCHGFINLCLRYFKHNNIFVFLYCKLIKINDFNKLSKFISRICKNKKYILLIDETDKSSNNFILLKFLGLLRDKYLARNAGDDYSFHSVILAGVYDIKNLKLKMIQAGTHQLIDGEKRLNSPWNIAANFDVDMSLNVKEISSMLLDYENDHKTGMDIDAVSSEIRIYTNGYPYLVSRLCQIIDKELNKEWTVFGVKEAVKTIIYEKNLLFDDIIKNVENNKELYDLLYDIIICGRNILFNYFNPPINLGVIYGILTDKNRILSVDNSIFEIFICDYFISKNNTSNKMPYSENQIILNNKLTMSLLIEKFAHHYFEIYNKKDINFLERECRLLFITYLRPFINGIGFYHIESETRNGERTDLIIDYASEQFIVELKLWYGDSAHENALEQITGYLDSKNKDTGYLLTFDFRKENNTGSPKMQWIEYNGKKIFDIIVGNL